MHRLTLCAPLLPAVLLAAGLAWSDPSLGAPEVGTTPVAPEVHSLAPFSRLDLAGTVDVVLIQGADESMAVEAGTHSGARVDAIVSGNVLRIQAGSGRHWWEWMLRGSAPRPRLILRYKNLDTIAASGDVRITTTTMDVPELRFSGAGTTFLRIENLTAHSLRFTGAGALKAEIGGRVTNQHISISGAGEYRGEKLASDSASVSVSGAGRVVVAVEKSLRANISGAGIVEYFGDPVVKQSVSGAGRVKRRESASEGPVNAPVASAEAASPA